MSGYGDGRVYRQATSKNWWLEYWVDGERYRESSGTPDRKDAEAILKRRITEKLAHHAGLTTFVGPQNTPISYLLNMLLDDYRIRGRRSLAETRYHLEAVRRLLGDCCQRR
jgi:hypothetical protein